VLGGSPGLASLNCQFFKFWLVKIKLDLELELGLKTGSDSQTKIKTKIL
jgi:hypothetical protein